MTCPQVKRLRTGVAGFSVLEYGAVDFQEKNVRVETLLGYLSLALRISWMPASRKSNAAHKTAAGVSPARRMTLFSPSMNAFMAYPPAGTSSGFR